MLAYFSVAADEDFWTEHWGSYSVDELVAIGRRSPLTTLIVNGLRDAGETRGIVIEAGCGLGQYVVLLRERGWRAVGADWSVDALSRCRQATGVPVVAMDLGALAVKDGTVAAYVSLGVVEHDQAGPDAILAEAGRVVAPGGVAIVSVPYLNGARRLGTPYLKRHARQIAAQGGRFYQYAFTRGELVTALARHGFTVRACHPYDPARLLRRFLPAAGHARGGGPATAAEGPGGRGLAGLARQLLYTEPFLRFFGHMLLAVARKR